MRVVKMVRFLIAAGCFALCASFATAQQPTDPAVKITVNWSAERKPLKTTPTLQVVVNPLLRRGASIHDAAFASLKSLGADYVRYVPWHPYPRLAVAELEAPGKEKTSWDFSLIDPMTIDFLNATEGHERILNFSTIPSWMYDSKKPVVVPADPDAVYWDYTQGRELRDPSRKELAGYYSRLVRWYTQGGFTDELGVRHESGYHYKIPYWEVFNEIDVEHQPTPEQYTKSYDAIVGELHAIDPAMKFVGLALAFPERNPEMMEYYLDHRNHKPGIPLDMISYHFYASPTKEQTLDNWQYTFFDQADKFLVAVRYVENIRRRLSPETRTTLDVVGESQLVGFPSQFPSVTMLDWTTGAPNARFEVLRLLHDHLTGGSTMVETRLIAKDVDALGFENADGRQLLLVDKRNRNVKVEVPAEFSGGMIWTVDEEQARASSTQIGSRELELGAFSVSILRAKASR
jgi:hypothetical protein